MTKPVTATGLRDMKRRGEPIVALTAYDHPTAVALDQAGVDLLLVGDSLGNVVLGQPHTLSVTMEDVLHHTRAVARGARRALVVADMPFMSYQADVAEAVRNAGRMLKEGGAAAVKLEGGHPGQIAAVRAIVEAGVPVVGHLGFTPQSLHALGGFKVQAKTAEDQAKLLEQALALQEAGVFALVLELVPADAAAAVTEALEIPTIGIGAGPRCDGQIQVFHDLVGLTTGRLPRHARPYASLLPQIVAAAEQYGADVRDGVFAPSERIAYLPSLPGDPAGPADGGLQGTSLDLPDVGFCLGDLG